VDHAALMPDAHSGFGMPIGGVLFTEGAVVPYAIGFGVCMAVRRSAIERLGGGDERLGPGAPDFPASDDMDFNYRLLRAGGTAYATPLPRAHHEQWRRRDELAPLWHGYMKAWAGFALKHLRTGDRAGGAWLYALGISDTLRVLVGALRRRSRINLAIAAARARGYAAGTRAGLARRW
jgi:GT2 family glycosyltransferase